MGAPDQTLSSLPKDFFLWSRRLQQILCLIFLLGMVIYEVLPAGHLGNYDMPLPNLVANGLQKVLIGAAFVSPLRFCNDMHTHI